ncbi:hypothetical protein ACFQ48_19200 [Hymenobacter caeli]|uniref:Phosphate starvation-inducible protein PsiF n=1 Tax=Hymenobacter caeli TaxID=2735894 RepID=A0ABX2FUZ9_9BACT|nr:hypothetical protein [Hymenobacter caeli]NRT21027.1 hypothetical protein [Hymenobacter caeli]
MKNTLLALALFAFAGTATFAHETPGKPAKGKKDNCPAMAAAQCTRGMASGNTAGMPACCRAKMAKMAAASAATAQVKAPVTKTM